MSLPAESQPLIRFGEFQLDLETAELRRNGTKSSLQGQPLQILAVLLERPGRVVTREVLKKRLWPPDTFVDFDQSLNRAVNRLREALDDSADAPRYIETLPRRGYRFIAEVSHKSQIYAFPPTSSPGSRSSSIAVAPSESAPFPPASVGTLPVRGLLNRWLFATDAGLFILLSAVACILVYYLRPALPPPKVAGYTQITHDGKQKSFSGQITATLLTDGPRLYLNENIDGRFVIVQVSADGGETVPLLTDLPNIALSDVSTDKSHALVGNFVQGTEAEQTMWDLPLFGGSPRRLAAGSDAAWMTNGDLLVARDTNLIVYPKDGRPPRQVRESSSKPIALVV